MSKIDIQFNVYSDTPKNKDPDTNSPTLRKYHQILWSKELPSKDSFDLDLSIPKYLHHESDLGKFILSSDSICHTYSNLKNMKEIISRLSKEEVTTFYSLASTIGAYIIFPANRIKNKMTINGARGLNRQIKDRFDLTLLCIKNFYEQKDSPLDDVLKRYDKFFDLFKNFKGYVSFFLLNVEIGLFSKLSRGNGHLKPDLFSSEINSQKKGRSCSFTLFSKMVRIYFFLFAIIT